MTVSRQKWLILLRESAWTEQNGRCAYCLSVLTRDRVTDDHVLARKNGGTDHKSNIKAACKPCNRLKGHTSHAGFIKIMKGRVYLGPRIEIQRIIRRVNLRADRAVTKINRLFTTTKETEDAKETVRAGGARVVLDRVPWGTTGGQVSRRDPYRRMGDS